MAFFVAGGQQAERCASEVFPDAEVARADSLGDLNQLLERQPNALLVDLDELGVCAIDLLVCAAKRRASTRRVALAATAPLSLAARAVNEGRVHLLVTSPVEPASLQHALLAVSLTDAAPLEWTRELVHRVHQLESTVGALKDEHQRQEKLMEAELSRHTAELLASLARMEEHALRDPLTQLFNVRYFHSRLEAEISRSRRHTRPLSLVFLDIDHFKVLNDRCGHPVGDKVIRGVAEVLEKGSAGVGGRRKPDVACRYGGEEFVVILPETDLPGCSLYAERLREQIASLRFPELEAQALRRVTASLGVAAFPSCAKSGAELVLAADRALLEAKGGGRNKVVVAPAL